MKETIIEKLEAMPEEICNQVNFGSLNVDVDEIKRLFNI